jgi:hypothetical protein
VGLHEQACRLCAPEGTRLLTADEFVDALYKKHAPKHTSLKRLLTRTPQIKEKNNVQAKGGGRS